MNDHKMRMTKDFADSYDARYAQLAPIKDALHLCIRAKFSTLPRQARILCVGVGTGAELIYLAQVFPEWEFTVVEPATAMLDVCRQRAQESCIATRCTFHEGNLDTLPDSAHFDAATSILVSHFILEEDKRIKYFSSIAKRLRPGAYMVNADLASDMSNENFKQLLEVWLKLHEHAEIPMNADAFVTKISLLPEESVAKIIEKSGFNTPMLFFKTLFIHAWFSKAAESN